MTEQTARRAVDWLHDEGCKVLAFHGRRGLASPCFRTQGGLLRGEARLLGVCADQWASCAPTLIDRLADAGVATFNLAVDSMEDRKELPKALRPIQRQCEYLIKKQYFYDYSVFFNINITRINLDDVKALTETAHEVGIATDYHINEAPMLEQSHFKHYSANPTFITPEDWPAVDSVIDWLVAKSRSGYEMVDSIARLQLMKLFMRGKLRDWNCRAGQNSLIIRTDGTLAPCFPMSLNHNLAYCYDAGRAFKWVMKQALRGFQGTTGGFDE
jgi:MoaA/NifB/PqqE/SkfB family radical SAM enzyme